jgi:chemotaxis protein histidine kinase CheA
MTNAIGMTDFFVLEAGEYLERLDALAQAPAGTFDDAAGFVRIARAFRGSALMASQQPLARAAQGLESVGRALRDGRLAWDEGVRGGLVRAVDDCKVLLRRVRTPSDQDTAKAEALGAELERVAGRPSAPARASGEGLDAGARAFVAREAAAIGSALDRVGHALASDPAARDPLAGVTQAMSALRGVAVLGDLPPLADLLIGVEGAIHEVNATSGPVAPAAAAAFDAGARALARAAREVVDLGRPTSDSEEAAAFATQLLQTFAGGGTVVPIETLFFEDAGPHVVAQGSAPAGMSRVEVVSEGEFLAGAAGALQRATSPVLRDLRLFGMAAALRPLTGAGTTPLGAALGRLADAGRAAIGRGAAEANLPMFVGLLGQAAETLRGAAHDDEAGLSESLDAVCVQLGELSTTPAAAPEPTAAPVAAAAPEALAGLPFLVTPAEAAAGEAPAEPEAVAPAEPGTALADAYAALARLAAATTPETSALDRLLAEPAEEAGVVPVELLAPHEDESGVVPVESLLYRGHAALKHALALQPEIEALLAARNGGAAQLAALVREVFDLVQLGLGTER